MTVLRKALIAGLLLCLCAAPLAAQNQANLFAAFAWQAADLALLAPDGWRAGERSDAEPGTTELRFASPDDAEFVRLITLPDDTPPGSLLAALQAAFTEEGLAPARYDDAELFGQPGVVATGTGSDGLLLRGLGARLPDNRPLLIVSAARAETIFQTVAQSLVFSAEATPTPPQAALFWAEPLPEPISFTDVSEPRIAGLTLLPDGRLVAAEPARGLVFFRPGVAGAQVIPFPNPSQPTGVASDAAGRIYVADPVCRCLQVYDGGWAAPLGVFAGGAPHQVAVGPDGTLYAIDGESGSYSLWIRDGAGERRLPLTFNAAAPPLLVSGGAAAAPRLIVIEWLQSLIDGQINAAVSEVRNEALALVGWLNESPEQIRAAALLPDGGLAVALAQGQVVQMGPEGVLLPLAGGSGIAPRALAAAGDGTLYVGLEDGMVLGRRMSLTPEQTGNGRLVADVPAQGQLSAAIGPHTWLYAGRAGDVLTLNATDLQRRNTVDMALTLFGPDGRELASNDDQRGLDLYNALDAQIPAFTLPNDGDYRIVVSPIGGSGTYTLGASADRPFALAEDGGTTRLNGALQDVFPAQRWVFDGRAGQTLTVTMIAQSGTLDPVLELFASDGRRFAYNDDAGEDLTLGNNAQLFRIQLPRDDRYILKAGRWEGVGRYELVIVPNT
jgi:hypothetical protein